nr:DUF86 domain-containing protein [Meiothermus hypogaeus]
MVGFRNVAVHDYQALSLPILKTILEERLGDFSSLLLRFGARTTQRAEADQRLYRRGGGRLLGADWRICGGDDAYTRFG